jgi:hypothetical protein
VILPEAVLATLLADFVDRESEMRLFESFLGERSRFILFCTGQGGMGKTRLTLKMQLEARRRRILTVSLDCDESSSYPVLLDQAARGVSELLRRNPNEAFPRLQSARRSWLEQKRRLSIDMQGSIHGEAGTGAGLRETSVQEMVGTKIVIGDIIMNGGGAAGLENDVLYAMSDAFFDDLKEIEFGSLLLFFDHVEKLTSEDRRWLDREFFKRCCENHHGSVQIVLSSRPEFMPSEIWKGLMVQLELRPVNADVVRDYLTRHRYALPFAEPAAKVLHSQTGGMMRCVAEAVERLLSDFPPDAMANRAP